MSRTITQGWLKGFREYSAQSESPEPYLLWVALSTLSGAVRRNIWIDQGHYNIYPNLYVVLVSPPGVCKKSMAMNMGLRLLRKVPGVNVESNKMTPQSLINSLANGGITVTTATTKATKKAQAANPGATPKPTTLLVADSTATLASSEFSVMLGSDSYQNGMLSLLTDLYDCPSEWEYKTLSREIERLTNVYLNILGATTPEWLGTSIPMDAIGGGFTSRILFVAQSQRRQDTPRPKRSQRDEELRDLLVQDLIHISKLKGEVTLDGEAEAFYDQWYRQRDRKGLDERFWGYLERKPDHLLKVAMLISVSFDDSLVITKHYLEAALAMLEKLEERMPEAFRGIGPTARDIERIAQQLLDSNNVLTFTELCHKNLRYLSKHDLNVVLETMQTALLVEDRTIGGTRVVRLRIGHRGGGSSGGPISATGAP